MFVCVCACVLCAAVRELYISETEREGEGGRETGWGGVGGGVPCWSQIWGHWIDGGSVNLAAARLPPELVIGLRSRSAAACCNRAAEGVLMDESIKRRVPPPGGHHRKIKEEK